MITLHRRMNIRPFMRRNTMSLNLISRYTITCCTRSGIRSAQIHLYLKVLFADYERGYAIIEFIGEWNDAINNDIMLMKREILDLMVDNGINKFVLIGENVLNFHSSDDCYYEEWFQDVEDGWIAGINFREHVIDEFKRNNIDYYINFGGELDDMVWRNLKPIQVFKKVEEQLVKRLN